MRHFMKRSDILTAIARIPQNPNEGAKEYGQRLYRAVLEPARLLGVRVSSSLDRMTRDTIRERLQDSGVTAGMVEGA